jgi:hypothetical protein
MENIFEMMYTIGYETIWRPAATGAAAPASHRVAEKDQKPAGGVPEDRMFGEFSLPVVERVSEERLKGFKTEAGAGKAHEIDPASKTDGDTDSVKRSVELRVFDRPLDATPGGRSDRKAFWHFISPEPSMAVSAGTGVELPETGETGTGTEPEGNCTLEKEQLAVYKKKPKNLVLTWSFWTKAGSFWPPMSSERGLHEGKRPYCSAPITVKRFRPFLHSASRPNEGVLPCTPDFIPTETSNPLKWLGFSVICSSTSTAMWYCSGTGVLRIKERQLKKSSENIIVYTASGFPDMHQNSIRMNSYGILSSARCPTVRLKICVILSNCCILHSKKSGNPKKGYGLAFMLLNYHGVNNIFHYLCVDQ